MELDIDSSTLDDFCGYFIENRDSILSEYIRKELKAYLHLVNRPWESFFPDFTFDKRGDITTLMVTSPKSEKEAVDLYWAFEWNEDITLVFTLATKGDYENTLQRKIRKKRGITEAWIKPSICRKIQEFILERHPATQIGYFVAKRKERDLTPCEHRPQFSRRFSYTGDDGRYVLDEIQHLYGVLPTSISYEVKSDLKLKVYEEGLIILRTINKESFELLFKILEMISEEIHESSLVARQMDTDIKLVDLEGGQISVPEVLAGEIHLPTNKLDTGTVEDFMEKADGFSFLDVVNEEGSLAFSATVIDDDKGSVFGLSASEDTIRLVPRYRPTFETFLRFCRQVAETIDEDAVLVRA